MRVPGAIYQGSEDRTYLAVYNNQHDVYIRLPPEFRDAKHVAHITYSKGGKKGGVSVFMLPESHPDLSSILDQKKEFRLREQGVEVQELSPHKNDCFLNLENIAETPNLYDIQEQIASRDSIIQREVSLMTRADILYFCGDKTAKKQRGPRIEIVDRIIPRTTLVRINQERMVTGGKQSFVPDCILEGNIDSSKGCLSSWVPGENPDFDGKTFIDYWSFLFGECIYCYAERQHKCFPKTIYRFDQKRLIKELNGAARIGFDSNEPIGRPIQVLRLGKRTEYWTPFTQDEFKSTLEACIQTKTRTIMPTKFLPFDPLTAHLLKRTKSSLLYSLGFDEFELGAQEWGATNEFRLEQAIKYKEAGVNTSLYLLILGHAPIGEREKHLLEVASHHHLSVQLLPARFSTKDVALRMTGLPWKLLKGTPRQASLLNDHPYRGTYSSTKKSKALVLEKIHPEWLGITGNNTGKVRMCHHTSEDTYCGGCYLKAGSITPTQHVKIGKIRNRPPRRKQTDTAPTNNNHLLFED